MVNPAAFPQLLLTGTPDQKSRIGDYLATQQDEQNQRTQHQLDTQRQSQNLLGQTLPSTAGGIGGVPMGNLPHWQRGNMGNMPAPSFGQVPMGVGAPMQQPGGGHMMQPTGGGMPGMSFAPRMTHNPGGQIHGYSQTQHPTSSGLDSWYRMNQPPPPAPTPGQNFAAWQQANPGATPSADQTAAANAFANAHGQNFDPKSGYSPMPAWQSTDNPDDTFDGKPRQPMKPSSPLVPGLAMKFNGGPVRAGQGFNASEFGQPEAFVPYNGGDAQLITQPGAYEAPSAGVVLPHTVVQQLPQLRADGITPLGNGDAVMSNPYGSGFATGAGRPDGTAPYMADPKTGVQLKPVNGQLLPVPDVLPQGNPWHQAGGMMGDPTIPRAAIAASFANAAPMIKAVQSIDPANLAAQAYLNDPASKLKEQWGNAALARAEQNSAQQAAGLRERGFAAARAADAMNTPGVGPGGLFTPAQMQRATQDAMKQANRPAGRQFLGSWAMNQTPAQQVQAQAIPGAPGYIMPVFNGHAFNPIRQVQPSATQNGAHFVDHNDGTGHWEDAKGTVVNPNHVVNSKTGLPVTGKGPHVGTVEAYRLDDTGKADHVIKVPIGKKPPPGYFFYDDANHDGKPDAGATPPVKAGMASAVRSKFDAMKGFLGIP